MKQKMKRILTMAIVLCLAANVFCITMETSQAAASTKTIKKTVKFKGYEAKALKFKTTADENLTITAKVKSASDPKGYFVTTFCEGTMYGANLSGSQKSDSKKIKFEKGTQNLILTSVGSGTVTLTIEIKAKKSVLKFASLKKTKIRKSSSSDDEK